MFVGLSGQIEELKNFVYSLRGRINKILSIDYFGTVSRIRVSIHVLGMGVNIIDVGLLEAIDVLLDNLDMGPRLMPHEVSILLDDIVRVSRIINMLEDMNRFIMRIRSLKAEIEKSIIDFGESKSILRILNDTEESLIALIRQEDILQRYVNDPNLWETRRNSIDRVLNEINRKLSRIRHAIGISPVEIPQAKIVGGVLLFGSDIGKYLLRKILGAKTKIIIFTQSIHNFIVRFGGRRTRILPVLEEKVREGVDVWVFSRHPLNMPRIPIDYIYALRRIYSMRLFRHMICWHMHMKIVVVDSETIIGSANFTGHGFRGLGEISVIIRDPTYAMVIEETYRSLSEKRHICCGSCERKNFCGSLYDLMPRILEDAIARAKRNNYLKTLVKLMSISNEITRYPSR